MKVPGKPRKQVHAPRGNPDPSRTLTLRRAMAAELRRRLARLRMEAVQRVEADLVLTTNSFCATGRGGGSDPHCSPRGHGAVGAVKSVVSGVSAAEHAARRLAADGVNAGIARLPERARSVVRGALRALTLGGKALFANWQLGQTLAERVAVARGLSKDQAKKLRGTLAALDLRAFEPFKLAALAGVHAAHVPAYVTGAVPVASTAYLAYSGLRNPVKTAGAALDLVAEGLGKLSPRRRGAHAPRAAVLGGEQLVRHAASGPEATVKAVADARAVHGWDDWHAALLAAALDHGLSGPGAVRLAAELYREHPKGPVGEDTDADAERLFGKAPTANTFCPTGPGGGVDPTCSPGSSHGGEIAPYKAGSGEGKLYVTKKGAGETDADTRNLAGAELASQDRRYGYKRSYYAKAVEEAHALDPVLGWGLTLAHDIARANTSKEAALVPAFWHSTGSAELIHYSRRTGALDTAIHLSSGNGYLTAEGRGGRRRIPDNATDEQASALLHRVMGFRAPAFLPEVSHVPKRPTGNVTVNALTDRVRSFADWFYQRASDLLADARGAWRGFIEGAFRKGVMRAATEAGPLPLPGPQLPGQPEKDLFVRLALARPTAADSVRLLLDRFASDLDGVTDAAEAALTRVLSDAGRRAAADVAGLVTATIDSFRPRLDAVAHDGVVRAHAEGQLEGMEGLGVAEVEPDVEWVFTTAGDRKVCARCRALAGVRFTVQQARGVIPVHALCRCRWVAVRVPVANGLTLDVGPAARAVARRG